MGFKQGETNDKIVVYQIISFYLWNSWKAWYGKYFEYTDINSLW